MKILLASLFQKYDIELATTAPNLECERLMVTKALTPVLIQVTDCNQKV